MKKYWIAHILVLIMGVFAYISFNSYIDPVVYMDMVELAPSTNSFVPEGMVVIQQQKSFIESIEGLIIAITGLLNAIIGIIQLVNNRKKDLDN
jgi:hypothetical protein